MALGSWLKAHGSWPEGAGLAPGRGPGPWGRAGLGPGPGARPQGAFRARDLETNNVEQGKL